MIETTRQQKIVKNTNIKSKNLIQRSCLMTEWYEYYLKFRLNTSRPFYRYILLDIINHVEAVVAFVTNPR